MATFIGTDQNETIRPGTVSPTITVIGNPNLSESDLIITAGGNDIVEGDLGNDTAFLGAGDDRFIWIQETAATWSRVSKASIRSSLTAPTSPRTSNFGYRRFSGSGERARFFRDVANITMDLDRVERIEFKALGGADQIVVNDLSRTDVREVALDLAGALGGGDGAIDRITLKGAGTGKLIVIQGAGTSLNVAGLHAAVSVANAEATDTLLIAAGGGDDTVNANNLAAGIVELTIDAGRGNDQVIGSAGADPSSPATATTRSLAGAATISA